MLLLCSLLASASPADGEPVDDPAASAALAAADALVTEAHRLAERGDPHGKSRPGLRAAAMAYQVFIKDFPLSERGPDALLTAGVLLERLGDARQAQEIFEAHVALYPDDERTNPLLFRLAAGHQSRLELDRAIGYYERLAHVGGQDYPDTPSAAYSAAFLRGVQGDHRGAAEGLERYVRDFPEQPDIWAVLSMAGPHWEAVGEREAAAFYQRLPTRT
jgi:tetratricopeptide (TPR) repeat protein